MKLPLFLLISLFSGVAFSAHVRTCSKPDDCEPDECCVIGMERYSLPQCRKNGTIGSWCRADAVPEDRMLYYPNSLVKEVLSAYTLFCPCADGYICEKRKCSKPLLISQNY